MKYTIFILLFWSFFSLAEFEELGKNPSDLNLPESFVFKTQPIKVVQKRWLDKKFLSEISLSVSPVLYGFNYMNTYAPVLSYRLFLGPYFSFYGKGHSYFNPINKEGKTELEKYGRNPLELQTAPQWSYLLGMDWYPFYGKAVLYNQLVSFDFYLSVGVGQIQLQDSYTQLKQSRVPWYSISLGQVQWWNKRFNTRLEAQASYFLFETLKESVRHKEFLYSLSISAGVLF